MNLRFRGCYKYFTNIWNWNDIIQFMVFVAYYVLRMVQNVEVIPDEDNTKDGNESITIIYTCLHTILIFFLLFKVMFYMRVSKYFSKLVRLVFEVVPHVMPFTLYCLLVLLCSSLIYRTAGVEIVEDYENYPHLHKFVALSIQTIRNGIGDLSPPTYEIWFQDYKSGDPKTSSQIVIIIIAWGLWLGNLYIILIVLLNFLIAIISEAYEQVMTIEECDTYQSRCDMNIEASIIKDYFRKFFRPKTKQYQIFYLVTNVESEDSEN